MNDDLKNIAVSIGAIFLMAILFFVIIYILNTQNDDENVKESQNMSSTNKRLNTPFKTPLSPFIS